MHCIAHMWMHLDHARSGSCKFVAKCFAKQISEHNSQLSGRRESRCAWIETTDTWQYLNILFRSVSRYQIWTLWRNRAAQDIFLIGYIVILPRILHHTFLGASFAFYVLISIVFHQEKSFDNDALFLIWKFVFWNQFDMVIFPLGARYALGLQIINQFNFKFSQSQK